MSDTILDFIAIFSTPSNRVLFTEVACYWFAHILHTRFSNSYIVYDPHRVHFATKINNKIYDITGIIEDDSEYIDWDEYSETFDDSEYISECCIDLRGGERI